MARVTGRVDTAATGTGRVTGRADTEVMGTGRVTAPVDTVAMETDRVAAGTQAIPWRRAVATPITLLRAITLSTTPRAKVMRSIPRGQGAMRGIRATVAPSTKGATAITALVPAKAMEAKSGTSPSRIRV